MFGVKDIQKESRTSTKLHNIGILKCTAKVVSDPDNGIAPGTAWEDLPEDFTCPVCGLDKDSFEKED